MTQSAATSVKRYLDYLVDPPKRSRNKRLAGEVREQIRDLKDEIGVTTNVLERLKLHQQVTELEARLHDEGSPDAGDDIEEDFIAHVKAWAEAKGVTYAALHDAGVPVRVLRQAGMSPG